MGLGLAKTLGNSLIKKHGFDFKSIEGGSEVNRLMCAEDRESIKEAERMVAASEKRYYSW
jgi:uncharacterized DUF497 family protein